MAIIRATFVPRGIAKWLARIDVLAEIGDWRFGTSKMAMKALVTCVW